MAAQSHPDVPKRLVSTMKGHTASVLSVRATFTGVNIRSADVEHASVLT